MDEAEARFNIKNCPVHNPETENICINYVCRGSQMFLAGLEAERERVKPLVEAATGFRGCFCGDGQGGNESHDRGCQLVRLQKALRAYTTPQNDGQRDSEEICCVHPKIPCGGCCAAGACDLHSDEGAKP